jgi:hypothetical protein
MVRVANCDARSTCAVHASPSTSLMVNTNTAFGTVYFRNYSPHFYAAQVFTTAVGTTQRRVLRQAAETVDICSAAPTYQRA